MNAIVRVHVEDALLPRVSNGSFYRTVGQRDRFVDACREIGYGLMMAKEADEKKARNRALGYGNQGFLVVFPYNTPAQTLTCLWAQGSSSSGGWTPLLGRRGKK